MKTYPNLFLIGAAKGGSTSLAFHLSEHPEVDFFSEKEPNFFNQETVEACRRRLQSRAHLLPSTRYILDASVNYSQYPKFKNVPQHIAEICGREEARFLYIIRNPVDRAISQYFWRKERYGEERSPKDALTPDSQYVMSSKYDLQIEKYLSIFPSDLFLFLVFDNYYTNVPAEYAKICRWLEISDSHIPLAEDARGATNKRVSREARFPALNRFVRNNSVARGLVKAILPHERQLQLAKTLSKEAPREEIDDETRGRLASFFTESISRTEELIGQDLSAWRTTSNWVTK